MVIVNYAAEIDKEVKMEARKLVYRCLITLPCLILSHNSLAASQGAFVGGGIGYGAIDTPNQIVFLTGTPTGTTPVFVNKDKHDIGGFAASAYFGYNFNRNLGLEASYNHFADSDYASQQTDTGESDTTVVSSNIEFKAKTYNVVAKGYLPFDNGFELFARGGASYVIQKVTYSTTAAAGASFFIPVDNDALATPKLGATTTKRIRPTAGIGAGFNFNPNMGVSFSWNHVFGNGNLKSDTDAIADLDMITFDFTYTFA